MQITFIGGLFTHINSDYIFNNSVGPQQNAADTLQWGFIEGFLENGVNLNIVNLPFVGGFPKRFRSIIMKSATYKVSDNVEVFEIGFINVSIVKYFSRMFVLLKFLFANRNQLSGRTIVIYSLHLPTLLPCVLSKIFIPQIALCSIIPDLPQYMSDTKNIFHILFKEIEAVVIKYLLKFVNFYVLLTNEMASALSLNSERATVIEGIARNSSQTTPECFADAEYILYSGTLASRYGIKNLVDAFCDSNQKNVELWICGDGDATNYVIERAKQFINIKYLGQITRAEVVELQRKALFLVNPRSPEGEYTKFSFPSKVIEYMCSGRPLLMYRLPGIPDEYYHHCYTPEDATQDSLRNSIQYLCNLDRNVLTRVGSNAKDFIFRTKSPYFQTKKLLNLLKESAR